MAVGLVSVLWSFRAASIYLFFFSSRRRHTRCSRDWSSDVCSSDLLVLPILLGGDWALRKEPREHQRMFRYLAGLLLVLLAVVMVSALRRGWLFVQGVGVSEVTPYAPPLLA